jgi:hypothetical protein
MQLSGGADDLMGAGDSFLSDELEVERLGN